MDKEISLVDFLQIKKQTLRIPDNSKKGEIDDEIKTIIDFLNIKTDYVTTSSCSGRIVVLTQGKDLDRSKIGCSWIYVDHSSIKNVDKFIEDIINGVDENLVLKFEPFILHVQCRTLSAAKILLTAAFDSGFRNSGIVLGKHGKIVLAVRSTTNLEVPLSHDGALLVTEQYLRFCATLLNDKMKKNVEQIKKFEELLISKFENDKDGWQQKNWKE